MNPIDQMMQAQGANSSQAMAALFSPQQTTEGQESGFSAMFANLMQNFQADRTQVASLNDGIEGLETLSPAQADFLATLGVVIPAEQKPAAFQGELGLPQPSVDTAGTAVLAGGAGQTGVASLIQLNVSDAPDGADGVANIATLPDGVKSQILQALQGMTDSGKLQPLTLTAPNGEAHVLPVSELAALINGTQAEGGSTLAPAVTTTATPAPDAPPQPAPATPTAADMATGQAGTSEGAAQPVAGETAAAVLSPGSETLAAGLTDNKQDVADKALAGQATANNAEANTGADGETATTAATTAQTLAAAAAATKDAAAQTDAVQQKPATQAETAPDGYMVAANQPQQNGAAQNTAGQSAKKPTGGSTQGSSLDKALSSATPGAEATTGKSEALTARAIDPAMPRTDAQPQMNVARDPVTLTMTPERLIGLPDGAASDIVSTGLSGMRGDGGFMASMSLLGGQASRGLQGHVAKQLNMSVSKAVKAGEQEFTMRLDPAELGRVQVKLRFMDGGRVHAQVVAERPETLDLLQRDARGLERAIEASGAKAQGATIEFSLDQGNQESAGRAFAEAVQQEKMRDELAARSAGGQAAGLAGDDAGAEDVPLDDILPYVDAETGLDIRV